MRTSADSGTTPRSVANNSTKSQEVGCTTAAYGRWTRLVCGVHMMCAVPAAVSLPPCTKPVQPHPPLPWYHHRTQQLPAPRQAAAAAMWDSPFHRVTRPFHLTRKDAVMVAAHATTGWVQQCTIPLDCCRSAATQEMAPNNPALETAGRLSPRPRPHLCPLHARHQSACIGCPAHATPPPCSDLQPVADRPPFNQLALQASIAGGTLATHSSAAHSVSNIQPLHTRSQRLGEETLMEPCPLHLPHPFPASSTFTRLAHSQCKRHQLHPQPPKQPLHPLVENNPPNQHTHNCGCGLHNAVSMAICPLHIE
jgi:hypothetical protein